jgi:ATP-binding cassette subfamily B protein/subfamily B ATP-binding cassette protein MsbA
MKNFARAIRLTLPHRMTLIGVFFTALFVGVLWGANIGAVGPFVEVIINDRSIPDWIAAEITEAQGSVAELEQSIGQIERQLEGLAGPEKSEAERQLALLHNRLVAEQQALAGYTRIQPVAARWLPETAFQTLIWLVAALLLGTALKNVAIVANMVLVQRLVQLAAFDLRTQFYRQTLQLNLASFGEHHNGELMSRFTYDLNGVATGLSDVYGRALREPLKMGACFVGASWISWQLLAFSLLVAPPAIILMRQLALSIKRASRRAMEEMSTLYNTLTETFSGIQTIKAFRMERFERSRFRRISKEFYHKSMKIALYTALTKPITELLGIGVICLALVSGAYLVLEHETHLFGFIKMCDRPISPIKLLLFYALLAGVSDPARKLSDLIAQLQNGAAAADRVYAMMDRKPDIDDPEQPRRVPEPHRQLVIDKVSFEYNHGEPVLRDVELCVPYGETIAIVGPNGCGKSTLINLIPRFYDPIDGAIRLDDCDLRELRLADIRGRIGLVTQQPHLFDDTVLNNIRYGSPRASDDDVIAAAKKAHVHRVITEKLSDGYETLVGQAGQRLSGGQRQRIALARAILCDPEILILDEATSQIDIESEQLIHKALQEFTHDRTAIMVTHRLSTLALADRVVVMDAGRIIDVGTHDDLLKRCPLYGRLHDIHFKQSA